MFECCTQRSKSEKNKLERGALAPKQQHHNLVRSFKERRKNKLDAFDQFTFSLSLAKKQKDKDSLIMCACLNYCTKAEEEEKGKYINPSNLSPVHLRSIASSSLPVSPSSLQRRKKSQPLPVSEEPIACDNFDCMTYEVQSENWTVARLNSRVFRFCSQECWTAWLENPGHLGSWSSPLLSYQEDEAVSPATLRISRDGYVDSPLMAELSGQKKPTVNLMDLPPLMI
jgi:hypothetical protein